MSVIGQLVAAAVWAVVASLVLSIVLGALVFGAIAVFRPAAAARQLLWSLALGAAGIAPVVILAAMLIRGALLPPDAMIMPPAEPPAAATHAGAASAAGHARLPSAIETIAAQAEHSAVHVPNPPDVAPAVADIIALVWALGALGGLAGLARSLLRVRGLKLRSSPLEGDLATELPWLTTTRGREIYLRLSYETETPIAVGFRRPVILLPTEMATADGLTSIEPLIMHEYAHLARFDDWTNLAQRTIERVFWFNPLVWMLGRRIALEREVAADEAVVARTRDAKTYASALWRMAQEMRMPEHVVVAPGAMLTRKQISVRIERLLDDAAPAAPRFGAAGFAMTALALTSVAALAATAPPIALVQSNAAIALVTPSPSPSARAARHTGSAPHRVTAIAQRSTPVPRHAAPIARSDRAALPLPPLPSGLPIEVQQTVQAALDRAQAGIAAHEAQREREEQTAGAAERERIADDREAARTVPISREMVASCTGCDFSHRNLRGVDLSGLDLTGSDFTRADLSGANLSNTKLQGVDFSNSRLTGANFSNANITGADFTRAKLDYANLTNAQLTGADLSNASMRNAITTGLHLTGSTLP